MHHLFLPTYKYLLTCLLEAFGQTRIVQGVYFFISTQLTWFTSLLQFAHRIQNIYDINAQFFGRLDDDIARSSIAGTGFTRFIPVLEALLESYALAFPLLSAVTGNRSATRWFTGRGCGDVVASARRRQRSPKFSTRGHERPTIVISQSPGDRCRFSSIALSSLLAAYGRERSPRSVISTRIILGRV